MFINFALEKKYYQKSMRRAEAKALKAVASLDWLRNLSELAAKDD